MNLLKLLDSRRHVWDFDTNKIPLESVVKKCLHKAWKVTPSKNNFMPYHVNVIGPKDKVYKDKIHALSRLNKKRTNEKYNVNNIENFEEDGSNPNFSFYNTAPYILVFSQRVAQPNPYIADAIINENDIYEQMHASMFANFQTTAAVEIGMFMQNATAFFLEQGIDTTYIKCYPAELEEWADFPFIEGPVLLLAGLGYCEFSRRDSMSEKAKASDYKPEPNEIIRFI
jgi:hypothetical protein